MQPINKKHLKKMNCPKCHRPRLRFVREADGKEPEVTTGPESKLRCDVCKVEFPASDTGIQAALSEVLAHVTPVVQVNRH